MEDALRVNKPCIVSFNDHAVLILVLMEDALRALSLTYYKAKPPVS